jgi:hypothetical protein
MANIKIIFNNNIINKLSKLNYKELITNSTNSAFDNNIIISVIINIYIINTSGDINTHGHNCWGLKVNYNINDFLNIKFKLKNVEVLMRLVSDNVIKSDLINGITYKQLAAQLNKNKK